MLLAVGVFTYLTYRIMNIIKRIEQGLEVIEFDDETLLDLPFCASEEVGDLVPLVERRKDDVLISLIP